MCLTHKLPPHFRICHSIGYWRLWVHMCRHNSKAGSHLWTMAQTSQRESPVLNSKLASTTSIFAVSCRLFLSSVYWIWLHIKHCHRTANLSCTPFIINCYVMVERNQYINWLQPMHAWDPFPVLDRITSHAIVYSIIT